MSIFTLLYSSLADHCLNFYKYKSVAAFKAVASIIFHVNKSYDKTKNELVHLSILCDLSTLYGSQPKVNLFLLNT